MELNQANCSVNHAGAFSNFGNVTEGMLKGKIFLKDSLKLTSMEVSLNNLPQRQKSPSITNTKKMRNSTSFLKDKVNFKSTEMN